MRELYIHDPTGRIISRLQANKATLALNASKNAGASVIAVHMEGELYISNGYPTLRPANPARFVGSTLRRLPVPCTITINGTEYPCNADHADITFDQPGKYTIVVAAWPYLDKEFTYDNPA